MPIRDYLCRECGHQFEYIESTPGDTPNCPHCDTTRVERLPALIGGYQGLNSGGASTRPRQSASFKNKKVRI